MLLSEFLIAAVLAVYYRFRILRNPERRTLLYKFFLIAAAAWLVEETCILFYRFYSYSPDWSLFILDVPASIVLIWPAVIFSARDIGVRLAGRKSNLVPLIAAGVVWTDASLIEPIAVHAGLWHWNPSGVLNVPLIGIFGWAYFTLFCILACDQRGSQTAFAVLRVLLAAAACHLALISTWWTAFKWVEAPVDRTFAVATAWAVSLFLSYILFRLGAGYRIEKKILLQRLPASLFIFGLLASADIDRLLSSYAAAFTLPYLTILAQQYAFSRSTDKKEYRASN
jgi:hypothetical protein